MMETAERKALGKKTRRQGREFEVKVREFLEREDWIVTRWTNTIIEGEIKPAKYNKFVRYTGFPDYLAIDKDNHTAILVESKMNNLLTKEEKEMFEVYKSKGLRCYVCYKDEEGKPKAREV